jgi:Flp pilus assembly protein TadG
MYLNNETFMPYRGIKDDENVIPAETGIQTQKVTGCLIKDSGHDEIEGFSGKKYWQKSQAIIETLFVLLLLFILFFGIAEIGRAWWLKNQLNNAARAGVRVAVVTPSLPSGSVSYSYPITGSGAAQPVFTAIWNSITTVTLQNSTTSAILTANDDNGISGINSGDTITVTVTGQFNSIVPVLSSISGGFVPNNITMTTYASMRYE